MMLLLDYHPDIFISPSNFHTIICKTCCHSFCNSSRFTKMFPRFIILVLQIIYLNQLFKKANAGFASTSTWSWNVVSSVRWWYPVALAWSSHAAEVLSQHLKAAVTWIRCNRPNMNPSQTEMLILHWSSQSVPVLSLKGMPLFVTGHLSCCSLNIYCHHYWVHCCVYYDFNLNNCGIFW